jgi:Rieske Fe-S protein
MSQQTPGGVPRGRTRAERWRAEFPYGWHADDLVSRRHLLRWAVMASGALFGATGILAGLGFVRERARGTTQQIANVSDVPAGTVRYFSYPDPGDHAILLHLDNGQFVAFSGKCTHLSCAVYYDAGEHKLLCPCHEGAFDPATGEVLAGPPPRPLSRINLRIENQTIYAVEEVPS